MSSNTQPRIALFLGAGASVPFGKPTTKKLKDDLKKKYEKLRDEILSEYAGKSNNRREKELWNSILLRSILSFKKFEDIEHVEFEDIEHVLQALKDMDDFFAGSVYGGIYLLSLIKGKYADKYSPDTVQDWRFSEYVKTIKEQRRSIENDIFNIYRWDYDYDETLGQIYDPLFGEINKYSRDIRIFTTNYDTAIEVYCDSEQRNYHCIDGFSPVRGSRRRKWDKGKYEAQVGEGEIPVYIYKLHGSLDWKRHKKHGIVATGEEGLSSDSNYIEPMLVYPTLSPKEGQEVKPYSTIRKHFKTLMKSTDVCIVIGFSFRDGHINRIFSDFINRGRGTIIVVSPSAEENIDKNLLEKYGLPQAKKTSHGDDENITRYDVNGTNIIAINDKMTVEDAEKIVRQKIGPHLSSPTGQRAPQS